jgi:hypothetical protein
VMEYWNIGILGWVELEMIGAAIGQICSWCQVSVKIEF